LLHERKTRPPSGARQDGARSTVAMTLRQSARGNLPGHLKSNPRCVIRELYYDVCMILSCRDKDTENILNRIPSKRFRAIQERAEERLAQLDAATNLKDLSFPSMRLEKLLGDRKGQYSIRVNDRYRVCFEWRDANAHQVEIVDYH
jgi:proteic killer suppression protein